MKGVSRGCLRRLLFPSPTRPRRRMQSPTYVVWLAWAYRRRGLDAAKDVGFDPQPPDLILADSSLTASIVQGAVRPRAANVASRFPSLVRAWTRVVEVSACNRNWAVAWTVGPGSIWWSGPPARELARLQQQCHTVDLGVFTFGKAAIYCAAVVMRGRSDLSGMKFPNIPVDARVY